jgi:hypothetical protein
VSGPFTFQEKYVLDVVRWSDVPAEPQPAVDAAALRTEGGAED